MTDTLYSEVQRPPAVFWVFAVVSFAAGVLWIEWLVGEIPRPGVPILAIGFCVALASLALTNMRTTVTPTEIRVRFWPVGTRTVTIGEIERCEPVTYRPFVHYGGWGWRWTPWAGTAYTLYGKRGVKLHLWSGKKVLIGSQQADALAAVIARLTKQARQSEA